MPLSLTDYLRETPLQHAKIGNTLNTLEAMGFLEVTYGKIYETKKKVAFIFSDGHTVSIYKKKAA